MTTETATSSRVHRRWPSRAPKSDPILEALWNGDHAPAVPFRASELDGLPEAARRYLRHAIADGTPRAGAVRLRMHGMIKIGGWQPFEAEQVIRWQRGFVWRACAMVKGLPVHGFDRWIDGSGELRWKLLGLLPLLSTAGPDISRSALGRLQIESVWLPSALHGVGVGWRANDEAHPEATFAVCGRAAQLRLTMDRTGRLQAVEVDRWGNPDHGPFRLIPFGGFVDEEATFGGYTIPSRLRIGWHFGSERFSDGEFFRVTVDDAVFRR